MLHQFGRSGLADVFDGGPLLVPMPRSGLVKPNSTWGPLKIAEALVAGGLGSRVVPILTRQRPVLKAATAPKGQRPTPAIHYHSFGVSLPVERPTKIVLVDDVVTRGATFAGAAARLAEIWPTIQIDAFAIARTGRLVTDVVEPCTGRIVATRDGSSSTRTP
jgi:hypothetical protein